MLRYVWVACCLLSLLSIAPARASAGDGARRLSRSEVDALLTAPDRRVRTLEPRIADLLEKGVLWSPTFRDLMVALSRSDVIVYIQTVAKLPGAVDGRLMLASTPGLPRYLRIQIRPDGSPAEIIALIGHELCHALEVADAPEVTDDDGLTALYRRIGYQEGRSGFDTAAATDTGKRVRMELGV